MLRWRPELAAEVLLEAVSAGLVGAEVTPAVGNRWLGDQALEPFLSAAESVGAVICVPPGLDRAWRVRPESRAKLEAPAVEVDPRCFFAVLGENASRLLWAKDRSASYQLHRQGGT